MKTTRAINTSYNFNSTIRKYGISTNPTVIDTLWVSITRLCNQSCNHCHVNASPSNKEQMSQNDIDRCLDILAKNDNCTNLDITGGAPELHPNFDYFITEARKLKKHVRIRHNLTVISDGNPQTGETKTYLPAFFADQNVEIIASFPNYNEETTDATRGKGAFRKSIEGIRLLNANGYGKDDTGLSLNLVYNSDGPILPADKKSLQSKFKQELKARFGLIFNELYTVTNMPIGRYRTYLKQSGIYHQYMNKLVCAFSHSAIQTLACRSLVNVGYDGRVYDCDFNQMLNMQIIHSDPITIDNIDLEALLHRKIRFGSHCFGCTAGGGSS
jgi:radical SAM/Cys-rich protein